MKYCQISKEMSSLFHNLTPTPPPPKLWIGTKNWCDVAPGMFWMCIEQILKHIEHALNILKIKIIICGEPAISLHSHHASLVLFASRHKVKSPGGTYVKPGFSCFSLHCCPDVIDHFCGFVWGRLCPEPSLGPHAYNVIIPLYLTQLFCPGFTLAAVPPSSFTTDGVGC